jgi:hypothetical protein
MRSWSSRRSPALLALVFAGHAFVNYDTAYALLWGGDLAGGARPTSSSSSPPRPHPLANVAGWSSTSAPPRLLAFVWLGRGGLPRPAPGSEWFGLAAGVAAAVLFLTREPVLSFGVRAYVDLPFLCLVLGALLVEVRRPAPAGRSSPCSRSPACCGPRRGCSAPRTWCGCATGACSRSPGRRPRCGCCTTCC